MNQRITPAKQATLQFIHTASAPFTAQDLIAHLALHGIEINKTTAYRQLEGLVNEGLLQEVNLNEGVTRYEPKHEHCHHHIVCTMCGKVAHVELDDTMLKLGESLSKQTGYKVEQHMLEFFGRCQECKDKK